MPSRIQRVAVLTSGGDSPGVNACVRAVVRTALHHGGQPWGVKAGYAGLLRSEFVALDSRSVSHIVERGGSFLGSSRCKAFESAHGLREAMRALNEQGIDALVVVGGDGTMRGAQALSEAGIAVVGIPATIENDVYGTDRAIGVDTALNTAVEALDRIKDTASSHEQAFLLELVGETCGYMALMTGLVGGAEMVCIPEVPYSLEQVGEIVSSSYVHGKKHCIIVVAAGAEPSASEIADYLESHSEETGFQVRRSTLGHIQRGGSPLAQDRFLATRLGAAAIEQLYAGQSGVLVGLIEGDVATTPLRQVAESSRTIDLDDYEMAQALAR